jgi:hypothetical protein
MLIIGSHALIAHGVKVGRRPSDIDVIATPDEIDAFIKSIDFLLPKIERKPKKVIVHLKEERPIEFEIADEETNPTAWDLHQSFLVATRKDSGQLMKGVFKGAHYVHPEVVLALKLSHRYLKNNPHFKKTMDDILALRGLKYRVPHELQDWLKRREKATYDYAHPSLMRDKKNFFSGDGVNYKYEHDDIHEALATIWNDDSGRCRPAYIVFQKDPKLDVSVSKEKWLACSETVRLNSVLEESYVLALERSQIPNDFAIAPRTSFLIALEKVCTSITSGWWREYAWEHYHQVLGMYSNDYVDRFQKALDDGKIRNYQGGAHE